MTIVNKEKCCFCDAKNSSHCFSLSKFAVRIKNRTIEKGILSLLKEVNRWCLDRTLHLSASEIILLRPDLLLEFLKFTYKTDITSYCFTEYKICNLCYEKYKKLVPER